VPKFRTKPQTPKEELLKGELLSPKRHPENTKKNRTARGIGRGSWGIGLGGCFLGTCAGVVLAAALAIAGALLASQALLKTLPPELQQQLSSQTGVQKLLEAITGGSLQKTMEERGTGTIKPLKNFNRKIEQSSPAASPSAGHRLF